MAGIETLARLAGVQIPEPVRFAINPTAYILGEIYKKLESSAGLPSQTLQTITNPAGAAADYVKTEAGNAALGQSNTSNIERILKELQPSRFEQARAAGETPSSVPSSITAPDAAQPIDTTVQQLSAILNGGSNTRSLSSQPSDTQTPPGYTFDPNIGAMVPMATDTQVPPGYTFDPNIGAMVPIATDTQAPPGYAFNPNSGMNEPIDFGGTMDYGDLFNDRESHGGGGKEMAYASGGQTCGCKR